MFVSYNPLLTDSISSRLSRKKSERPQSAGDRIDYTNEPLDEDTLKTLDGHE
jgi:hypothetical protein